MSGIRSALVIGVDDYENEIYPLSGCVADAIKMANCLKNDFGFSVRILATKDDNAVDGKPTRKNILAELDSLANVSSARNDDDIVVIFYAGRGSICVKNQFSESGRSETIVPCDSSRHPNGESTDIFDCELNNKLFQINLKRTNNIVLFFDTCYFGPVPKCTDSKNLTDKHRMAEPLNPTYDTLLSKRVATQILLLSKMPVVQPCCVTINASDYGETAWESDAGGYFTNGLIAALKEKGAHKCTYLELATKAKDALNRSDPLLPQNPVVCGVAQSTLFEQASLERDREFKALLNNDGTIAIAGGKMHGVEINSIWNVYLICLTDETAAKLVSTAICERSEDAYSILRPIVALASPPSSSSSSAASSFRYTACCISLPSAKRGCVFVELQNKELFPVLDAVLTGLSHSAMIKVVFEKKDAQWLLKIDGTPLKNVDEEVVGHKDVAASVTTMQGDALLIPVVKKGNSTAQQWSKYIVANLEQLHNLERVMQIKPIRPLSEVYARLRTAETIFLGKTEDAVATVEIFNTQHKPLYAFFVQCKLDGSVEPSDAIKIDEGASVSQTINLGKPFMIYEFDMFSVKQLSLKLIVTEEDNVSLEGLRQTPFRMPFAKQRAKGHGSKEKDITSCWAAFEFFVEARYKHQIRSVDDAKAIQDALPLQFELVSSGLSRNFMLKCLQIRVDEEKSIYKDQSPSLQFVRDNYSLVDPTTTPQIFVLNENAKEKASSSSSSSLSTTLYGGPACRLAIAKKAQGNDKQDNGDGKKKRKTGESSNSMKID